MAMKEATLVTLLKIERTKRGIKSIWIAKATGIHPSRLSRIENGWDEPRKEEYEAIAKALGCSIEDILGPKVGGKLSRVEGK
jgi:transcriptional regulator with XRE-family HTH domain